MVAIRITKVLIALLVLYGLSAAKGGEPSIQGLDLYVVGDDTYVPKTKAALRIVTTGVTGMLDSVPVSAALTVALSGEKTQTLFEGRSDSLGVAKVSFGLPDWPDGSYQMEIVANNKHGQRRVSRQVTLSRSGKILLVTDKPIYQPRQLIHMRALALDSYSLRPLAKEPVRFEVQDPKGNKVFKRRLVTDDYGVVATRFQLADEINLGNYQIEVTPEEKQRAEPAMKTVAVKKYVLPKFKVQVSTDKDFYLPKETIFGTLQSDYFFGKPVAQGRVEIKASTFDVAFKEFATLKGTTDKNGGWKFQLELPDYFVGQPLQSGDAVVKLDIKLVDTAKHVEKTIKSLPVAAEPIRLAVVPEGGHLVAGVENQIYAVATYPDGSPAKAKLVMQRADKVIGRTTTDATGLGVFQLTPDLADMRMGDIKTVTGARGQQRQVRLQALDLSFSAMDKRGNRCTISQALSTEPTGDKVLLRTNQAIYKAGESISGSVLSTAGSSVAFIDIVKNRQTLLTRSTPITRGTARFRFPLSPEIFGSIEIHAYQILKNGEIMRDARVVYVHPPSQLAVTVTPDKKIYKPGDRGLFRFKVVDQKGRPAAAALGVIVVDEAVYALQELKPGLEKVYFTLEKQLSDPKYQIEFGPSESLANLVKQRKIETQKQRIAQVLLAKVEPLALPSLWQNPVRERIQKADTDHWAIQSAMVRWAQLHPVARSMGKGRWAYRRFLLQEMVAGGFLAKDNTVDPMGAPYTMQVVATLWPELRPDVFLPQQEWNRIWNLRSQIYNDVQRKTQGFSRQGALPLDKMLQFSFRSALRPDHVVKHDVMGRRYRWAKLKQRPGFQVSDYIAQIHGQRVQTIYYALARLGRESSSWYRRSLHNEENDTYELPKDAFERCRKQGYLSKGHTVDVWGRPFVLRKIKKERSKLYHHQLRFYELYSMGRDGLAGTADDMIYHRPSHDGGYRALLEQVGYDPEAIARQMRDVMPAVAFGADDDMMMDAEPAMKMMPAGGRGGGLLDGVLGAAQGVVANAPRASKVDMSAATVSQPLEPSTPAKPKQRKVRVRQFFPETLLFEPALITDGRGVATLEVPIADSITTWRLAASANGKNWGLGSVSKGIRVFQDFFVDIDLPVSLTQNDEVAVPVVVYNYLKSPQRVRLELNRQSWFSLSGESVQEMQLQPNEVAATFFRIKVHKLGRKTLQVQADGSSMSDAIKREIEILPDGKEQNIAHNGRLEGTVKKTLIVPPSAIPEASKILVRLYPGVFSQVVEGMESLLRLPGG